MDIIVGRIRNLEGVIGYNGLKKLFLEIKVGF